PWSVSRRSPVATSHRRTVLSEEPLARYFPSALNTTLLTACVWPRKVLSFRSFAVSHKMIVLSVEALARIGSTGLNATLVTVLRCFPRLFRSRFSTFHTCTDRSVEAMARRLLFGS